MESASTPTTNSGATAERSDAPVTAGQATSLRKTPLNALHRKLGARMVNFGGWEMPVEYPATGGLVAEHKAVRNSVGVFDVSHMGDIRIRSGKTPGGALAAVQHLSMNDAAKLALGQAQYSAMLYPQGTFVDDVIVHRMGEDDFLLVINAGTREKDISWVRDNSKEMDCVVEDYSDAYTQLAIQGPRAVDVMKKLTDANVDSIKNYWFTHGTVCGLPCRLIARQVIRAKMDLRFMFPATRPQAKWYGTRCWKRARSLQFCRAGWARETRCASKRRWRYTGTKSAKPSMFGKPVLTAIAKWRRGTSSGGRRWRRLRRLR